MTTLSLASNNTTTSPEILSGKQMLTRYADHLSRESWCMDYSVHPVKALHAKSNHNAVPEYFRDEFPSWARRNNVRIPASEYHDFLKNLVSNLTPLLPRVLGTSFRPSPEQFFTGCNGAKLANTYVAFKPDIPSLSLLSPAILDEYFDRIFANEQDKKIVIQYCADIIQNPLRRPQWGLVITGEQGTGKSSLFRLISLALGNRHTWENNDYKPAFKQFSEVLPNNLLVSFDDAKADKGTYNDLKQNMTCNSMQVEIKGMQKLVHREVYARIVIFSNSTRPLIIEAGDRRLYATERSEHKISPEETAAFFVDFNLWLDKETTAAVLYHYFMSIDLSDFVSGSTTQTATLQEMIGLSTTVLESLIDTYIEDEPIFHNDQLYDYLAQNGIKNPLGDVIKLKMADRSYKMARRTVDGCGEKQIYVWQKSSKGTRSRAITAKEALAIQEIHERRF